LGICVSHYRFTFIYINHTPLGRELKAAQNKRKADKEKFISFIGQNVNISLHVFLQLASP